MINLSDFVRISLKLKLSIVLIKMIIIINIIIIIINKIKLIWWFNLLIIQGNDLQGWIIIIINKWYFPSSRKIGLSFYSMSISWNDHHHDISWIHISLNHDNKRILTVFSVIRINLISWLNSAYIYYYVSMRFN